MEIEQLLAEGPIQSLLGLMFVPVLGAIVLGLYLFFVFNRRQKKAKMKLGIQPPEKNLEADDKKTDNELARQAEALAENSLAGEADLDLGLLRKHPDPEADIDKLPLPPVIDEPVDLTTRLNFEAVESTPPPLPAQMLMPAQMLNSAESPTVDSHVSVPPMQNTASVELLRLLRDTQSGKLIVEVAGQRYTKLADIADKNVGQYVLKLAAHLLSFTNGVIITTVGMRPVYNPKNKAGDVPKPLTPQIDTEAEAAFLTSLQADVPTALAPKSPNRGFLGVGGQPSKAAAPTPGLNLADEINNIVQTRLRYSTLANSIRIVITADIGGGICINVNDQVYSSPNDIPDPEVKALIKASIKEWESS